MQMQGIKADVHRRVAGEKVLYKLLLWKKNCHHKYLTEIDFGWSKIENEPNW